MLILCNWDLAVSPPPLPLFGSAGALPSCFANDEILTSSESSLQFNSQPALCTRVKNIYEIKQFPWKRIFFFINPSMRLKASYFRPKKKKFKLFLCVPFLERRKKRSSNNSFGTKDNVMITRENNLFIQLWFLFLSNLFLFLCNLFWSGFKMFMMKFLCKWKC